VGWLTKMKNFILSDAHLCDIYFLQAIDKLQVEAVQQRNNNMALQGHLDALRQTLTANFCNTPLPGKSWPLKLSIYCPSLFYKSAPGVILLYSVLFL